MITIGIDPGYDRLGIAVIETRNNGEENLLYSNCFASDKKANFSERLGFVVKKVKEQILLYKPSILVLEEVFFSGNQKTAMRISEVRGAIIYLAYELGLRLINLTPLQIKISLTGYGRAGKDQVIKMVNQIIKIPFKQNRLDDEYDAIAIAIAGVAEARQIFIHNRELG